MNFRGYFYKIIVPNEKGVCFLIKEAAYEK
jgi:hypothetical protein